MKNILIFCPSYTSLLPALGVIEKNKTENIVLIISEINLYRFLKSTFINKYFIKFVELNTPIFSKNPFHYLKIYQKYRYIFNKHFKNIKDHDIYFFVNLWFELGFKIIKKLAKSNKVYYYNCYPPNDFSNSKHNSVKEFILQKVFRLEMNVFSLDYDIPVLRDLYFKNNKIEILKNVPYSESIKNIFNKKNNWFNLKNKKVLILTGGFEYIKGVDTAKFAKVWEKILKIIKEQYYDNEILVKAHPRFKSVIKPLKKYLINELNIVPAEILRSVKQFELVIGISSTALLFPSDVKTKTISVIKLFELPQKTMDFFFFHLNNKIILRPKNLIEFRNEVKK